MKQVKTITKTKTRIAVEVALVVLAVGSMAAGLAFSAYKKNPRYQNDNSADINRDGRIDKKDLRIVNSSLNNVDCPVYGCCNEGNKKMFDCNLNDDGKIDNLDVQIVISKINDKNTACGLCKQVVSLPSDWCVDGRIISRGKDECGCPLAPKCEPNSHNNNINNSRKTY